MRIPNLHAKIIIEELVRHQIKYFCLAPGSRVTPFTHSIAYHNDSEDFVHFDERGLGFHALGYAKAHQRVAPLFITSGSSLANLFPAVVEAYQSETPMLIFSADRPYELRDCGANQTMDQVNFFHKYAIWHQDLPLFEPTCSLDFLGSTVGLALHKSRKGPVHLNCQFREPFFEPLEIDGSKYSSWQEQRKPHSVFFASKKVLSQKTQLDPSKRGIIICGKETTPEEFESIKKLAHKLRWPILPDILSTGRFGHSSPVIPYFDLIFKNHPELEIESVLHFKDNYLSKPLLLHLDKQNLSSYTVVSDLEKRINPNHSKTDYYTCSIESFCKEVEVTQPPIKNSWLNFWEDLNSSIEIYLNAKSTELASITEPFFMRSLLEQSNSQDLFFIASSRPIRDALSFGSAHPLKIYSNRGVSGIDGNLATAFGLSQAHDQPISVVIGDTACLYDLNSLAMAHELQHSPTIWVVNNAGGGIFSFLPIAKDKKIMKRYFQAEHAYTFEKIAKQFDLEYFQPQTKQELFDIQKTKKIKPTLIEIRTEIEENVSLHKKMDQELKCLFSQKKLGTQTILH